MPYIASNNGLTVVWKEAGSVLQSGEVDMGAEYPTLAQIRAAFPNYSLGVSAQQWAAYQAQAQAALAESDTTMHRIGEAVALGKTTWTAPDVVTFVQWRNALRAILSQTQPATIPASLPVRPAYPAGT